jgi:hypothetical protein
MTFQMAWKCLFTSQMQLKGSSKPHMRMRMHVLVHDPANWAAAAEDVGWYGLHI